MIAVALDDAEREAREVEVVGAVHVGELGGLAAEQRAARLAAAVGDALDHVGDALGVEPPDGDVVEEQHRLGAAGEHVVDAHRHEVDARVAQTAGLALQQELRADAVGAGDQHGIAIAARRDEAGEAAEVAEHARRARRGDRAAHAVDDRRRRLAARRRPARRTAARGRRSCARGLALSKRSLSASTASGTGTGIDAGQAGAAEAVGGALDRELQAVEREVGQRVGAEVRADLLDACGRRRSARPAWPCRCRRSRATRSAAPRRAGAPRARPRRAASARSCASSSRARSSRRRRRGACPRSRAAAG